MKEKILRGANELIYQNKEHDGKAKAIEKWGYKPSLEKFCIDGVSTEQQAMFPTPLMKSWGSKENKPLFPP